MQSSRLNPPAQKDLRRAFAEAIVERRNELAVSQEMLAEACDLSVSYVSLLERGQRNLTVYSAAKLAAALGMQTSQLVLLAEAKLKNLKRQ
ncbi:helix-turn-helix domain-containing protein [Variovorax sp. OV329]|uniref:helix-turn-helix domain-containing protein n=1 Tax=Variovorax sp. OV329 TaxID=1882825 RepID=UPI0008ED316A|nr:helix-turn-helix transcriptional regulator [Variovorax sp. OV329]SFM27767.1 transcriptional regulator, XRE family [Variovorax sp. OV329]